MAAHRQRITCQQPDRRGVRLCGPARRTTTQVRLLQGRVRDRLPRCRRQLGWASRRTIGNRPRRRLGRERGASRAQVRGGRLERSTLPRQHRRRQSCSGPPRARAWMLWAGGHCDLRTAAFYSRSWPATRPVATWWRCTCRSLRKVRVGRRMSRQFVYLRVRLLGSASTPASVVDGCASNKRACSSRRALRSTTSAPATPVTAPKDYGLFDGRQPAFWGTRFRRAEGCGPDEHGSRRDRTLA